MPPLFRPFPKFEKATFIERPNRFIVHCRYRGRTIRAYMPNPGRMRELLLPGAQLHFTRNEPGSTRKTDFTIVAVEREGLPILLHTHLTNDAARFLLEQRAIAGLEKAEITRAEYTVGRSRFDFLMQEAGHNLLLEVKSCTLFGKRAALFPDAVTARGRRHLEELAALSDEGYKTAVLFMVHSPRPAFFAPDYHTDPEFAHTLLKVRNKVRVLAASIRWQKDLTLEAKARLLPIPWKAVERESQDRGSYLLLLRLKRRRRLKVGRLGDLDFPSGYYIYAGSAMANLTARLARHRRLRKKHHWHIDYLREQSECVTALPIRSAERQECPLAEAVSRLGLNSIPGFGSSDCACPTHLFHFREDPQNLPEIQELLLDFRERGLLSDSLY